MLNGLLLIDKPAGPSSFEVVRRVRRVFKVRKVGHLGTLDPFATGLLPLALGEATKLAPYLMDAAKTYLARVKFGEETDTLDPTGTVVARCGQLPEPEDIRRTAACFVGEIEQVPPRFSAVHYEGQRLYKLARQGVAVQPEPRRVAVHKLEVKEIALPEAVIEVTCGKGTYIRVLAADLGRALGSCAHLAALRRLAVGRFRVEAALPLAELANLDREELRERLIPLADCLPELNMVPVDREEALRLSQGRAVTAPANGLQNGEQVRVLLNGHLVALALVQHAGGQAVLAPKRVFLAMPQA
ncbi:MAG: tRNA pseudouridine(55) synthase TruB [Deltaproteobacteria bacterium]|nr:tRNA pseudouridine(55) synthase TruB [Deltaproteobacteria bacterium]